MADDEMKAEAAAEGETPAMERKEHKRRRRGGGTESDGSEKAQEYNAQGSNEMSEAKDETASFKRGGHKKRAAGGMAEGDMAMPRMDRRPRRAAGGKVSGHSPYSSASALVGPESGNRGFEGTARKP